MKRNGQTIIFKSVKKNDYTFPEYADTSWAMSQYLVDEHGFEHRTLIGKVGRTGGKLHRLSCVVKETTHTEFGRTYPVMIIWSCISDCGAAHYNASLYQIPISIVSENKEDITCKKCL